MAQEKKIENKIREAWIGAGGYAIKNHGGQYTPKGQPDLTGCFDGRYIAMEVKEPNGRITPVQLKHLKQIAAAGGVAVIAYDTTAFTAILNHVRFGKPMKTVMVAENDADITVEYAKKLWAKVDKTYPLVQIVLASEATAETVVIDTLVDKDEAGNDIMPF